MSTDRSGNRVDPGRRVEPRTGQGYVPIARDEGGILFELPVGVWEALGRDRDMSWAIKEQFLRNQLEAGVSRIDFVLESIEHVEQRNGRHAGAQGCMMLTRAA